MSSGTVRPPAPPMRAGDGRSDRERRTRNVFVPGEKQETNVAERVKQTNKPAGAFRSASRQTLEKARDGSYSRPVGQGSRRLEAQQRERALWNADVAARRKEADTHVSRARKKTEWTGPRLSLFFFFFLSGDNAPPSQQTPCRAARVGRRRRPPCTASRSSWSESSLYSTAAVYTVYTTCPRGETARRVAHKGRLSSWPRECGIHVHALSVYTFAARSAELTVTASLSRRDFAFNAIAFEAPCRR